MDEETYQQASVDLLLKLSNSFREIARVNDADFIKIFPEDRGIEITVDMKPYPYVYQIEFDDSDQALILKAPKGSYYYKYDLNEQWWKCVADDHNIEEFLMRDFAEFAKGYLHF